MFRRNDHASNTHQSAKCRSNHRPILGRTRFECDVRYTDRQSHLVRVDRAWRSDHHHGFRDGYSRMRAVHHPRIHHEEAGSAHHNRVLALAWRSSRRPVLVCSVLHKRCEHSLHRLQAHGQHRRQRSSRNYRAKSQTPSACSTGFPVRMDFVPVQHDVPNRGTRCAVHAAVCDRRRHQSAHARDVPPRSLIRLSLRNCRPRHCRTHGPPVQARRRALPKHRPSRGSCNVRLLRGAVLHGAYDRKTGQCRPHKLGTHHP